MQPPNPSPTDQVMVLLERRKAEALLPEVIGSEDTVDLQREARIAIRSALSQEVEERREYRVVAGHGDHLEVLLPAHPARLNEYQGRALAQWAADGKEDPREQARTTYTYKDGSQLVTAWSDLEEGE